MCMSVDRPLHWCIRPSSCFSRPCHSTWSSDPGQRSSRCLERERASPAPAVRPPDSRTNSPPACTGCAPIPKLACLVEVLSPLQARRFTPCTSCLCPSLGRGCRHPDGRRHITHGIPCNGTHFTRREAAPVPGAPAHQLLPHAANPVVALEPSSPLPYCPVIS